jgi:hypothetical protein
MAMRYSKEMRQTAKEKDWFLVQISIDGKCLSKAAAARLQKKVIGHGRIQITGPMNQEQTVSLWRWYERWDKKKKREYAAKRKRTEATNG